MVAIEEIVEEIPASEERRMDAEAIEAVVTKVDRPTARMHLEALAKKLRRESEALKRVEQSRAKAEAAAADKADKPTEPKAEEKKESPKEEKKDEVPVPSPVPTKTKNAPIPGSKYTPIDRFMFDAGKYNSPLVAVYVPFPQGETITKEMVTCDFTASSFDLVIANPAGKSYRLFKDNLSHDIDPEKSKFIVKSSQVIVKLGKVKGEYGFDSWTDLVDKKKRRKDADGKRKKDNPSESIMSLMKDMYDSGDDNMRKIIGETMEKQRRGELGRDGMGMGDMGGMGGMGGMGF
uniref:CS domain-containing protein n=1 Tax=Cyclophora tenuis TaxID=216820 RepID=A0A7S1GNL3_CYCTE|mmetsp:Transcript_23536/g.39928  ORF Transcript_23536/g.39928 Transcript_23536/m.39928 type:complete len:291 (+) Transcript_23536:33-905(+)